MSDKISTIKMPFGEGIDFFKGWLKHPKQVGAVVATSRYASRSMASVVRPEGDLPVLEVGAGTGVVTRQILARGLPPEKLVIIEYAAGFAARLKREFPQSRVIHGDVLEMDALVGTPDQQKFDCVISGIPMLNLKPDERIDIIKRFLARVPRGRPVIQITHGPKNPVPSDGTKFHAARHDVVLRNLPPAYLWSYTLPTTV